MHGSWYCTSQVTQGWDLGNSKEAPHCHGFQEDLMPLNSSRHGIICKGTVKGLLSAQESSISQHTQCLTWSMFWTSVPFPAVRIVCVLRFKTDTAPEIVRPGNLRLETLPILFTSVSLVSSIVFVYSGYPKTYLINKLIVSYKWIAQGNGSLRYPSL